MGIPPCSGGWRVRGFPLLDGPGKKVDSLGIRLWSGAVARVVRCHVVHRTPLHALDGPNRARPYSLVLLGVHMNVAFLEGSPPPSPVGQHRILAVRPYPASHLFVGREAELHFRRDRTLNQDVGHSC
jgi:hypothetical protein